MWGSGGIAPSYLTSALGGNVWSASRPGRFTPGERAPGYPLGRRQGGPQGQFRPVQRKILHYRDLNPGRAARSPSLNRLSYSYS
jgi:hypothetical protein